MALLEGLLSASWKSRGMGTLRQYSTYALCPLRVVLCSCKRTSQFIHGSLHSGAVKQLLDACLHLLVQAIDVNGGHRGLGVLQEMDEGITPGEHHQVAVKVASGHARDTVVLLEHNGLAP